MKKVKSGFIALIIGAVSWNFCACSEEDDVFTDTEQEVNTDVVTMKTCSATFDVKLTEFDQTETRATSDAWVNGDKVYLTFSESAYGIAEYTSGSWSVNYYGTLKTSAWTQCEARYFDNPSFASSSVVKSSAHTGVYEDLKGTYFFDGATLSITASLTPKTGRIRFKGTSGSVITLFGITHVSSFGVSSGTVSESQGAISLTVNSDGYTPYVYGRFTDTESPRINILSSTSAYNRSCPTTIFKTGESGYMNIPTESSHAGWMNSLTFKFNGVEFTMIPVLNGTTLYCLAETETTNALYCAIMGKTTTRPSYPWHFDYQSDCITFISKLNALTELSFRLPTKDEWQYAAKGGDQSQGYTYSGSNLISEVAWYSLNSDSKSHEVAKLMPNELGFYDMSGNLCEWTSTKSSYGYYYHCGGSYNSGESSCKVTSSDYDSSNSYCGLRLALSINQ